MAKKDELNLEKYPEKFQKFLKEEIEIVKQFVKTSDKVLDIGCGAGRAIVDISPLVSKYVGIDIDEHYLSQAKVLADKFDNSEVIKLDVENLSDKFNENEFDKTFCLFNTLGSFKDYQKALKEIYHVTKNKFYFSVVAKGTKKIRQEYYNMIGVKVRFDDEETSYSSAWGEVKAFNEKEIRNFCKEVGFKIEKIDLIEEYSYTIIAFK
ncbi:class I SAM-dependent methyltransferase [Nanoarchaeota archaeon]